MNKRYLSAIERITPPSESVEKMMSAAINVNNDKKKGIKRYIAAGLAACLVLALAIGGLTGVKFLGGDDFALTAYAVEGGNVIGSGLVKIDTLDIGASEYYSDDKNEKYSLQAFCDFDVVVDGKNIESVEYSIINGEFLVEIGNNVFKEKKNPKGKTVELGTEEDHLGSKEFRYEAYGSFSVDYDNQPERETYESGEYRFARGPVTIGVRSDEKDGDDIKKALKSYGGDDQSALFLYKKMFENLEVVVTAQYRDGTSESESFVFSADRAEKNGDTDVDIMIKKKQE